MSVVDKSPAFQFYVGDFLSDDAVALMSNEQVGCYVFLLCHQWKRPDGLPAALPALARLARTATARFERTIWPGLTEKFEPNAAGLLQNGKLERVRAEMIAYRDGKSRAGKASAAVRQQTRQQKLNSVTTDEARDSQRNSTLQSSTSNKNPPTPPLARGAHRVTRPERHRAEEARRNAFGRCPHEPPCSTYDACVVAIALESRAKVDA